MSDLPNKQTAQHALDERQMLATQRGYAAYQSEAPAVSLTNSTDSIQTQWGDGYVLLDGDRTAVASGTRTHSDGDADKPRWDALVVEDTSGEASRPQAQVNVVSGTPEAPATYTDEQGNEIEIRGEPAWKPAPSDTIGLDVAVLAIVWIPEGAASNPDLSDQTVGGVANPVIDRRIAGRELAERQSRKATITASGWYRIATNGPVVDGGSGGNRAFGRFLVQDRQSQLHSSTSFTAATHFGDRPTLSLDNHSWFSNGGGIRKIRLVTGGTFEGSALEVYVDRGPQSSVDVEFSITENRQVSGWEPEPWTPGGVPSGFSTTMLDFDAVEAVTAIAIDGDTNTAAVDRSGTVHAEGIEIPDIGARAYREGNQNVPGDGTDTQVTFGTKNYDTHGQYNVGTGEFTAKFDGFHLMRANFVFSGDTPADTNLRGTVQVNGEIKDVDWDNSDASPTTLRPMDVRPLTAGDVVTATIRQTSGSSTSVSGGGSSCYFEIIKMNGGGAL